MRLERAMGLFLLSLRRDPTLAKALFNLGILCAQSSRWSDAISFQSEFQMQPAVEPAWLKSSASEVERLKTIMRLEGTAEGKLRRRLDTELWPVLEMTDPIKALNEVGRLARLDKNRWEAPALAGIFHAETKAYSESAGALDEAARLAEAARLPPQRTANLKLAADAARREAAFAGRVREAGIFWEKQQYETAAKGYQAAWKAIPTRLETGMQAATGFLMADQVAPAVEILSSMRESAPPEMAAKISAMLHELGAISEDANAAAGRIPEASQSAPPVELATQIRTLVGPLASSEVELVVRPAAPLLSDTSYVTPIPDEEVTGPRSDMAFNSTVSIFAMYQRDLALSATRFEGLPGPQPAPVPPVATPLAPAAVAPPPPEPIRNSAPGGPAMLPPVTGRPGAADKGQEAALEAARRDADNLIDDLERRKIKLVEIGVPELTGVANSSIIEPMALLYQRSGDPKYLAFAQSIIAQWNALYSTAPQGIHLLEKALEDAPPLQNHAYAIMSCFEGICELYRATGDRQYLNAAVRFGLSVRRYERMIDGSASNHELFCEGARSQTEFLEKPQETCATVTWIKLCTQLLRLTGDPVWADEMELSLYNAMVGAMTPSGEWFAYFTQLAGERVPSFIPHADLNLSCCVASASRGMLLTPRWAVMTAPEGPVVNLYAPGTASVTLAGGTEVRIVQETAYPDRKSTRLNSSPARKQRFTVRLRIPAWSQRTALAINGETVACEPGKYAKLEREWAPGDQVLLTLDLRGRVLRAPSGAPQLALMRGPILLALACGSRPRQTGFRGSAPCTRRWF